MRNGEDIEPAGEGNDDDGDEFHPRVFDRCNVCGKGPLDDDESGTGMCEHCAFCWQGEAK